MEFYYTENSRYTYFRNGFTLIEMLIALLLITTMIAWLTPSVQALGHHSVLNSEVSRLRSAFALARHTAISQRMKVTVCPASPSFTACSHTWGNALLIIKGDTEKGIHPENIVRIFPEQIGAYTTYSRGWQRISYNALGHASGYNGSFDICATREEGKRLVLSQLGRLRVESAPIGC
ncbi:GspH/FimT family pseudopilin [Vreelandella lutescens]|uniref:Type II secretion system protein H n=1 Tax=Vreelandella lutescens TaxID=1602943 RepID=A0ABQ1PLT8_9GAMM|nr:GspH/FimT family pseudopilin [Halomonas lutescens]GGC99460.1 hypothetical protein GCM10011382_32460 [Halomonas lutescens]